MAQTEPASRGAYAKSAETRRTILDAAIVAFGEHGLEGASTRAIAAAAGVNQPALNYHFGSKDGLYVECARAIVERFAAGTAPASAAAIALLADGAPIEPVEALARLHQLMDALVETLVLNEEAAIWAGFVAREMNAPGAAFAILYENLWQPGTELAARLISAARGEHRPGEDSRLEALMLISNLIAFTNGRRVSKAIMGWSDIGSEQVAAVRRSIARQIDALVAAKTGE
ncbi:CerR family C-terminal domain-containing protein [Erythrobacter mangrovi]|uniref:CerR family C-terminal domain-containing protein n=1 Tax=Erythrobacter mangrovi TaxID=2739433 RepID=A0A7D4BWL7_9SPHN|nr:CerR family C-terminal domain-containing protein [Erythrobacter mangrovi]QKG72007.1 CerR family C-terminal domain-containing protein [Erythrobacter mangrovi]